MLRCYNSDMADVLDFPRIGSPRLTLRNVRVSKSLSKDSTAFTATVVFDGKAFEASNHGTGGMTTFRGDRATITAAEKYAATLGAGHDTLDAAVEMQLASIDLEKDLRARTRRNLCFLLPGEDVGRGYRLVKGPADAQARAWLAKHHPNAIVLNDRMPAAKPARG